MNFHEILYWGVLQKNFSTFQFCLKSHNNNRYFTCISVRRRNWMGNPRNKIHSQRGTHKTMWGISEMITSHRKVPPVHLLKCHWPQTALASLVPLTKVKVHVLPAHQALYNYLQYLLESILWYCYMCEVSLVVALALLQQCNSTTLAFP
jgi:hypothetical protein